ncbi:MAG: hypothetical protein ACFFDN_40560, partial [Candidatus Hodarchaeota archaeon]
YVNTPESYGNIADTPLEDFKKINEFLKKNVIELEKLSDKKGARFLAKRLKGLTKTFETVQNIWSDIEFIFTQQKKEN